MDVFNWVMAHSNDLLLLGTSLISAGWIIAKLTPNQKDDRFMGKIQKIFDVFNGKKN